MAKIIQSYSMNTKDGRVRVLGKTYFNSGVTGNGRMLATFTDKGELNRVFWPSQDYYQHINNFFVKDLKVILFVDPF